VKHGDTPHPAPLTSD
jgi:hypothetical protein